MEMNQGKQSSACLPAAHKVPRRLPPEAASAPGHACQLLHLPSNKITRPHICSLLQSVC